MKFLLKSPYPCLVKTNDAECELGQNDLLEIEDEKTVFIYPQNSNIIPFYINLSAPKDCERYSFFSRGEKKYVILENEPKFETKSKEKLNFSGKNVEICVENGKISFETQNRKIQCACESAGKDFSCFKIQNFACVQFENELFVFSMKENKVFHFVGEIEIDGNQISVTKKFFDSDSREKKSVFQIKEDIELESEEFVSKATSQAEKTHDLAPFKFMESIKAKDYAFATSFLSEKLKNQIDISQIQQFFGNFSAFLPISTTEFIIICGKNKNFVQFSLHDCLIDDISIDAL